MKRKIKLVDLAEERNGEVNCEVDITQAGIGIKFEGYSTSCMEDSEGEVVWIELWDGKLTVNVWSDISSEDPTHRIDLKKARNENRPDDDDGS